MAGSHELGQDYEHVTLLIERFKEFAKETECIGTERVAAVNEIADSLISVGHTDAATIAQWKDSLNDAWADLLELIDTRNQMLDASRELHKYFHDCKVRFSQIIYYLNGIINQSIFYCTKEKNPFILILFNSYQSRSIIHSVEYFYFIYLVSIVSI